MRYSACCSIFSYFLRLRLLYARIHELGNLNNRRNVFSNWMCSLFSLFSATLTSTGVFGKADARLPAFVAERIIHAFIFKVSAWTRQNQNELAWNIIIKRLEILKVLVWIPEFHIWSYSTCAVMDKQDDKFSRIDAHLSYPLFQCGIASFWI